jgi:hypothetical protein
MHLMYILHKVFSHRSEFDCLPHCIKKSTMNHSNNRSKLTAPSHLPISDMDKRKTISTEHYKDIIFSTNNVTSCQLPYHLNCSPLSSLPSHVIRQSLSSLYASLVAMSIPFEEYRFVTMHMLNTVPTSEFYKLVPLCCVCWRNRPYTHSV